MLIDFKQNLELEEQIIKRDIHRLENQLSKLTDSLSLLRTLKRKVEAAKRMMKIAKDQ